MAINIISSDILCSEEKILNTQFILGGKVYNYHKTIYNKFVNNVRSKSIDHSIIMPILVEPTYPKISNLTPIGSRFLFSQYSNYFLVAPVELLVSHLLKKSKLNVSHLIKRRHSPAK